MQLENVKVLYYKTIYYNINRLCTYILIAYQKEMSRKNIYRFYGALKQRYLVNLFIIVYEYTIVVLPSINMFMNRFYKIRYLYLHVKQI